MMMNIMKIFKKITSTSFIFAIFIAITSGMLVWHTHSTRKTKQLQIEIIRVQEKNKQLRIQNEELAKQVEVQIKKDRELANELIKLSEKKSECYKKIIKYNQKFKRIGTKKPHRVEHLVNKHFNSLFKDVASTTATNKQ